MTERSRINLRRISRDAMLERGFLIDFPPAVLEEVTAAVVPSCDSKSLRDLSSLLWSSIDNDDSKDLDQIEHSERISGGFRILVAIADVNSLVKKGTATDDYARQITTSVYTGVETYPMLPRKFSNDLTSLNESEKRRAIVVEMEVSDDAEIRNASVYPAIVVNKAQLTYNAVTAWLEKVSGPHSPVTARVLDKIGASVELQQQLIDQDSCAQLMCSKRFAHGALDFETIELSPTFNSEGTMVLIIRQANRASHIIEEFMIASNQIVDSFLEARKISYIQRVVRTPKNWSRMVELASESGGMLPYEPDGLALQRFLAKSKLLDPASFPDLSLAMIKLLGRGEYVVKRAGEAGLGHFGHAACNYSHTTAPNRRYPDLIMQRLLQSSFDADATPYTQQELEGLASHCTLREDDANKVERKVRKSAAAVVLSSQIGKVFSGIITGASPKGVFVRIFSPPVEGKIDGQTSGVKVGDRVRVKLVHTDPYKGFIDFKITQ